MEKGSRVLRIGLRIEGNMSLVLRIHSKLYFRRSGSHKLRVSWHMKFDEKKCTSRTQTTNTKQDAT